MIRLKCERCTRKFARRNKRAGARALAADHEVGMNAAGGAGRRRGYHHTVKCVHRWSHEVVHVSPIPITTGLFPPPRIGSSGWLACEPPRQQN